MIVRRAVVAPFAENAWLVGCPDSSEAVLVDPGGEIPELLAAAEEEGVEVRAVWLTHAHLDHVAGVAEVVERTGVPVLLHRDDLFLYEGAPEQGRAFGLAVDAPPRPDGWLADGDELEVGRLRARVAHVPGHSPGHVAFHLLGQGILLSGDCLFAGSIGRTDLPGGDHDTLMTSIRDRILTLDDEVRILPGHGPETTVGWERHNNPFLGAVG